MIAHIFSSDLQRAVKTAEAIREAQSPAPPPTTKLQLLREQDFGFYEGKKFIERPREGNQNGKDVHIEAHHNNPGFVDVESKMSMGIRVESFIDMHLVPLMHEVEEDRSVAVVAHDIILSHLWRAMLKRFYPFVTAAPGVLDGRGMGLEYLGGWSNTGYLDLEVKKRTGFSGISSESATGADISSKTSPLSTSIAPALPDGSTSGVIRLEAPSTSSSSILHKHSVPPTLEVDTAPPSPRSLIGLALTVKAVNSQEHLKNLKKTRGGIGSLKHDSRQQTVDSFFKKRKFELDPPCRDRARSG